jgi:predicted RNA-binding protein YlqC (UPF0109 family)
VSDAPDRAIDDVSDSDEDTSDDPNRVPAATARGVLEYLVRQLVDDPEAVSVEVDDSGRRPVLNVSVGPGDLGRVIGKRGRVAKAVRRVTRAAAVKDGVEVDIEFLE